MSSPAEEGSTALLPYEKKLKRSRKLSRFLNLKLRGYPDTRRLTRPMEPSSIGLWSRWTRPNTVYPASANSNASERPMPVSSPFQISERTARDMGRTEASPSPAFMTAIAVLRGLTSACLGIPTSQAPQSYSLK